MANAPIPSWYEGTNTTSAEINSVVQYGQVDADTMSPLHEMFFWNNRGGVDNVSVMEDVKITTRDRNGGTGDTVGNIVEAVRDDWMEVRSDSDGGITFTPIGKGGSGKINPSGMASLGTNGRTINVNASTATVWTASNAYSLGQFVKPSVDNGFIYEVVMAGTSDTVEPTWLLTEGLFIEDGTVRFVTVPIEKTPDANTILGLANSTLPDGTNAEDAGGNFIKFTTRMNVPSTATSGVNQGSIRMNWKYV